MDIDKKTTRRIIKYLRTAKGTYKSLFYYHYPRKKKGFKENDPYHKKEREKAIKEINKINKIIKVLKNGK